MTLSVIAGGSSNIPPPSSELRSLSTGKAKKIIAKISETYRKVNCILVL